MIERVPNYYTGDKCALITLPFKMCITVFDDNVYKNNIICHYDFTDDSQNINKYLTDDRKNSFPYANIPMYKGLFGRYYINGLFEYNKHYICIIDGFVRDRYLVKDGDNTIVLNRCLYVPMHVKGNIFSKKDIIEILNSYRDVILFDKFGRRYYYDKDHFNDIEHFISVGGGLFIYNKNNCNIIRIIKINDNIGIDDFCYKEFDISLNEYTKEELKYFSSKIRNVRDICVYSCINPNIDSRIISENKRLVRKLSK